MSIKTGELFRGIPANLDDEFITELLARENLSIRRIVSMGHTSPATGWYDQPDNEWVLVVKGEGKISFEDGSVHHLTEGSYINIPAHTRHKVIWTTPVTETIWLAIHYD